MSFSIQSRAKVTHNRYTELLKQAKSAGAALNRRLAKETAEEARARVPVATGALRDSIHVEVDRATGSARAVAGDESAPYADIVENGTHLKEGNPFMRESTKIVVKRNRRKAVRLYRG